MNQDGLCLDCNGALLRLFEGSTREEFSKYRLFQLTSYEKGTKKVDSAQEDMGNLYKAIDLGLIGGVTADSRRRTAFSFDSADNFIQLLWRAASHHHMQTLSGGAQAELGAHAAQGPHANHSCSIPVCSPDATNR